MKVNPGSTSPFIQTRRPVQTDNLRGSQSTGAAAMARPLQVSGAEQTATSAKVAKAEPTPPGSFTCGTCQPMSVEDLMKDWGKTDSQYDFDGNGVVDVDDLFTLIHNQTAGTPAGESSDALTPGAAAEPSAQLSIAAAPEATVTNDDPASGLTLEGLQQAWGQTDSPYDLNGSGVVDIDDLFQFFGQTAESGANPATGNPSAGSATSNNQGAPSLEGIMTDWGHNQTVNDVNHTGGVNIDDLFQFLGGMPAPTTPAGTPSGNTTVAFTPIAPTDQPGSTPSEAPVNPPQVGNSQANASSTAARRRDRAELQRMGDRLISKLADAGFQNTPPTNIRELVTSLRISPGQQDLLLQRLSNQFPNGLGVNLKA